MAVDCPPTKRSRSESDESAFLANPVDPQLKSLSANAGPSSAKLHVPMTEVTAATGSACAGLDAKLGIYS